MNQPGGGESIALMVLRHEQDLYRGNGKPGLTNRMQSAEQCIGEHEDRMDRVDKSMDDMRKMFWAIVLLLLTILGGVVTDIVRKPAENQRVSQF